MYNIWFITIVIFLTSSIIKDVNSYMIPRDPPLTGCAKINSDYLRFKAEIVINYKDVKDCYESIPYNKDIAISTIETIKSTLTQFYVFLDKAKENPQTPGLTFSKQDLIAELDALLPNSYTSDIQFFMALQNLLDPLMDGHLNILSDCYNVFRFEQGLSLYSSVKQDGSQIIQIFNDSIDPTNIDCEVTQIDNQPALQFIIDYATTKIDDSKDLGVRFNLALTSLSLLDDKIVPAINSQQFTRRFQLPENESYTYTLKCSNATVPITTKTITRNWIVKTPPSILDSGGLKNPETFFKTFCLKKEPKLVDAPKNSSFFEEIKHNINKLYQIDLKFDQKVTQGVLIFDADIFKFYMLPNNTGVAVIGSFHPLNITTLEDTFPHMINLIKGFQLLTTNGAKKVVLDFSNNGGGVILLARFFTALLMPKSNIYEYPFDMKLTELNLLAIETAAAILPNSSISFNPRTCVDTKTLNRLNTTEDMIGNNFKTRGGVKSRYTNKFFIYSPEEVQELLGNVTIPWKPTDYVILSNGFCGSACAMAAQLFEELWNVTTVAVGGLYDTPLSYSSFTGGTTTDLDNMLGQLQFLGINSTNNKLVPKEFLTNTILTFSYQETYSYRGTGEILLEYDFRPAKYRIYYDAENIRDPSKLWLQAVGFVQG